MSKREPYEFTVAEEIANSSTHAVGSHLGAAMLTLLVVYGAQSHHLTSWKVVSGAIYGSTIILLYSVSSVYHALANSKAKRVMEILDHMAIYFLIAGSYTPILLVTLRPDYPGLAWTMFGIVWGMTLIGVIMKCFTTGRFRIISTLAYIVMGWIAVIAIGPICKTLDDSGTMWLFIGGGLYTLGTIFYVWRVMPFHHVIWHLFVMAGTISHFFCVLFSIMMK